MEKARKRSLALIGSLLAISPVYGQLASSGASNASAAAKWITLGTNGGPIPAKSRSQPSNLLVLNGKHYLVDSGGGVERQLAQMGLSVSNLAAVFISHLHFDHTAGLYTVLGLRWQTNAPQHLRIYGPPGTKKMVEGLLASMIPAAEIGFGISGSTTRDPQLEADVVELRDSDTIAIDGFHVRVRNNSHYTVEASERNDSSAQSLAYRFDLPGRSITYTGDTGPSAAVVELASGSDLLVSEMIDADFAIGNLRRAVAGGALAAPEKVIKDVEKHLRSHHLLASDVGELAAKAGVGAVIVTHFSGRDVDDPRHLGYLREIAKKYNGPAAIAEDLDAF
jgi:ribonuclease BN (tRNA processing enzyme)